MASNRLEGFSDEEIYVIKRAFLDSGFYTDYSGIFNEKHKEVRKKLLSEFATEDTLRVTKE